MLEGIWDQPAKIYPATLSLKDSWTTSFHGVQTLEGVSSPLDIEYEESVEAAESVTTPAGTFDTLRVETYFDGTKIFTDNLVEGIGMVQSGSYHLVSLQ